MTDEAMIVFMLRHLRPCIPFLVCSNRLERRFLKHTLQLFGEAPTRVRVQAVLFIRHMAVSLPAPALSLAMKVGSFLLPLEKHLCIYITWQFPRDSQWQSRETHRCT